MYYGRQHAEVAALGEGPTRPSLTPVVYLRGAGVRQPAWDRIERAMWARGWDTTHDRTSAFHLARGGVPVVLVDFTSQLPNGLSRGVITVGRVRARYRDDHEEGTLVDLLTTADAAQAWRDHAPWINHPVTIVTTEMELPLISGGDIPRPYRLDEDRAEVLDEQAIVRAVAERASDEGRVSGPTLA